MSDSYYLGISKDKIARIWEGPDGFFTVTDFWGRNLGVYGNDADAGERARDLGYEEIFWEDVQETPMDDPENFYAPSTEHPEKDLPQSPPPTPASNAIAAELRERADGQATPAAREYSNLYDEVSSLMALAVELVDDHAVMVAEDSSPPTWEHVGDMKHVRQLIKQLVAFLSPDGE